MSASKLARQFTFHGAADSVFLAGSFNSWSKHVEMARTVGPEPAFAATVEIDPRAPTLYKFIVDGVWTHSDAFPTAVDANGNINNILIGGPETPSGAPKSASEHPANTGPCHVHVGAADSEIPTAPIEQSLAGPGPKPLADGRQSHDPPSGPAPAKSTRKRLCAVI